MAGLTLRNVAKSYGSTNVITGLDLDIKDSEFVVFVGPSGCGKSTLLRMIAGLEDISGGTISIGDTVVNDVAPAKRGVAMVFQTYALYPHMTVYKNMAFGLKQAKTPADEIDRRVRAAAEILKYRLCLTAHRAHYLVASVSVLPSGAQLCASLTYFCLTSHYQILMLRCGCRHGLKLPACISVWAQL